MTMSNSQLASTELPPFRTVPNKVKQVVLMKILQELQSAPDLPTLLQNIYRMVHEEFNSASSLVSLYDPYRDELIYHAPSPKAESTDFKLKLGEGLAGHVGATKTPLRVFDLRPFSASQTIYESFGIRFQNLLAAPLIRRDDLLGVIEVFFLEEAGRPTDPDLQYLSSLSSQFAVGLNYFRLHQQTDRISLEEEKLTEVSKRISASLDLDELLDLIIEAMRSLLPYDAAGIYLMSRSSPEIQRMVVYGYDLNVDEADITNLGRAAREIVNEKGRAAILPGVDQHKAFTNAKATARSAMAAPILSNYRMIGVFTLVSDEPDVYTEQNLILLEKFTHQVALSIEKAQLHQALMEKKKLEQELSIARGIQLSFLPRKEPPLEGYEVAGLNLPSRLVSGDYYDFIKIVDGQWGLVIGDVSGKGIPSSLIMASFRASLLAEIRNNYSIRTIMAKVNQLLWESTDAHQFVTAFYGVLDEKRRVLTYCNAGHNPVLLIHSDGSCMKLETGGLILGAFSDAVYWENFVNIMPNDILLLYTDGVTEIYDEGEEEFGVERLRDLVTASRHLSARAITLLVKEKVLEFAANRTPQDDFTLVVLKALET